VSGIEMVSVAAERRKDPEARRAVMSDVDVVILCLPDDAAKESVALADSLGARARASSTPAPRIVWRPTGCSAFPS